MASRSRGKIAAQIHDFRIGAAFSLSESFFLKRKISSCKEIEVVAGMILALQKRFRALRVKVLETKSDNRAMNEGAITFQTLLILVLVVLNGVFSMSEIAVVSSRKARLHNLAENGDEGARRALALSEHPTRFLSTVQIGITFVGVFVGAYGGANLAGKSDSYLERFTRLKSGRKCVKTQGKDVSVLCRPPCFLRVHKGTGNLKVNEEDISSCFC